jgi:hypothetical protein
VSDLEDLAEARAKLRDKGSAWRAQLLLSATKEPRPLLANALLALYEATEWGGVLGFDNFALTAMALRPPPWVRTNGEWTSRAWSDRDDTLTAEWLAAPRHRHLGSRGRRSRAGSGSGSFLPPSARVSREP